MTSSKYNHARDAAFALNRLLRRRVRPRKGENRSDLKADRALVRKIMSDPNILGFAVGPKKSGKGSKTSDFCLVFFVRRKLPESRLRNSVPIPKQLLLKTLGLRVITDVQEWGGIPVAHSGARAGTSICGQDGESGTTTLIVTDNETGNPAILSCSHVIAACGRGQVGDDVELPVRGASGPGSRVVGKLRLFTFIDDASDNLVDAALADPVEGTRLSNHIPQIGKPSGIRDLLLDGEDAHLIDVQRFGARTGLQNGKISNLHLSARIAYPQLGGKTVFFTDMANYDAPSDGGDSGAPVVDTSDEPRVVGMHLAGLPDGTSLFTHISHVFDLMRVRFRDR